MSGGHFDYNQRRIQSIAEDIQEVLDRQGKENDYNWSSDWLEKYPEDRFFEIYPEDIQQIFKDAIYALNKAYIYAQRIDWYLSGDDGEDDLKRRLSEELKELDEKKEI